MAGYNDTRNLIIEAIMGRQAGTEIQPEKHQAYALNMLDYVRSVELISTSTLAGLAEENTVPVQPNNGKVCYIAGVSQDRTVTFSNFIDDEGNPISITTGEMEGVFVILLWNMEHWVAYTFNTNIISSAESNFYYDYNIRKTYASVAAMNADSVNPIGTDGRLIKIGELVTVVNSTTPAENGYYSYEGSENGWRLQSGFSFEIVQTTGTDVNKVMSQKAVTEALQSGFSFEIVQTTGTDVNKVMSQKAVTDELTATNAAMNELINVQLPKKADHGYSTGETPKTLKQIEGLIESGTFNPSDAAVLFLNLISNLQSGLKIGNDAQPIPIHFAGPIYNSEKEIDIAGQNEIGEGTSTIIDLNVSDKFRIINANGSLLINNVTNPSNGAMFVLVIIASGDTTITFSNDWGDIEQPVEIVPGTSLMISGYVSGGGIIASHNSKTIVIQEAPVLGSFTLGTSESTQIKQIPIALQSSGGHYSMYKLVEGATQASLAETTWIFGVVPETFTLSETNGLKTVWLQLKNIGGESSALSDTITLDVPVPVLSSVIIGDDSGMSNSSNISIAITASNSPTHYKITHVPAGSTAPDFAQIAWSVYNPQINYSIMTEGTFDVYIIVKNEGNVESNVISESITIDYPDDLPIISINEVDAICEHSTASLSATGVNYSTLMWSTSGDGVFSSTAILNPTYTPGSNDKSNGTVTLTLTATNNGLDAYDTIELQIQKGVSINAGTDQTISDVQTASLNPSVSNFSSLLWSTDGDGTFSSTTSASSVYTPGVQDKINGSVLLTLTAQPISPCIQAESDTLILTIEEATQTPITVQVNHGHIPNTVIAGWNYIKELRSTEADYTVVNAIDSLGNTTGIGIVKSLVVHSAITGEIDPIRSTAYVRPNVNGPNQIIDGSPAEYNATSMEVSEERYGQLLFSGLNPNKQYKFRVLCSNVVTAGASTNLAVVTDASLIAQESDLVKFADNVDIYNKLTPIESPAFTPAADGTVSLVCWKPAGSTAHNWNWTKLIEL